MKALINITAARNKVQSYRKISFKTFERRKSRLATCLGKLFSGQDGGKYKYKYIYIYRHRDNGKIYGLCTRAQIKSLIT